MFTWILAQDAPPAQNGDESTETPADPAAEVPAEEPTNILDGAPEMPASLDDVGSADFWQGLFTWLIGILPTMILAIVLFVVALIVAGWAGALMRSALRRAKVDETVAIFLGKLVRWTVLVAAILTCLTVFGVQITSFAAILAAAGFAIGLAFQGTLGSFASGVMLLTFRPFKVGDVVKLGGELGKVAEIDLFTTSIDTLDNRRIIMPNGSVFGSTIENITFHDKRRVDVPVGAEYSADIDATRAALVKAHEDLGDQIMADPEPAVVLTGLGDSSVNWVVRVWCPTVDYWDVYQALTRSVKMNLDAANIGIPFPQMDVHLDGKLEKNSE